ncbi:MAG: hypothetical protein ACOY5W_17165 [Pseudomonadota bacterium]
MLFGFAQAVPVPAPLPVPVINIWSFKNSGVTDSAVVSAGGVWWANPTQTFKTNNLLVVQGDVPTIWMGSGFNTDNDLADFYPSYAGRFW